MTIKPPAPPYVGPAAHTSVGSNQPINRIVIHCTVSPCVAGGARATAAFFRDPKSGGSAHYVVDPGEAVQVVYDDTIAWHAPPNANSIGVELTDALVSADWDHANAARWSDARHTAMLQRAAELVAQLALAYKVPIVKLSAADLQAGKHGICGHVDVSQAFHQSDHWDPGTTFPWATFMGLVKAAARDLQSKDKPTPPPAPKPTPKPKPTPAPKPLGKTYTGIHASGKFNGNPDEWAAYIAEIATAHKATWVTLTEEQQKGIAPKMRAALGPEWLVQTQGEYILATRNAVQVGKAFRLFVTTVVGLIGWRQMRPAAFDVKIDGRRFRFYVIHGPSAIENGDKWVVDRRTGKYPPRVLAAQRGWHRLGRRMARFAKSHPNAVQLPAGDTNLDNHRHFLGWLSVALGAPSVWEGHLPPAGMGTHGARLIDTAHVLGATVVDAQIVPEPRPAGFDHQPLVYKIR